MFLKMSLGKVESVSRLYLAGGVYLSWILRRALITSNMTAQPAVVKERAEQIGTVQGGHPWR